MERALGRSPEVSCKGRMSGEGFARQLFNVTVTARSFQETEIISVQLIPLVRNLA